MTKKAEKPDSEIILQALSHPNVKGLVVETDGRWRVKLVEGEPYSGKGDASLIEFCKKSLKL